MKIMFQTLVFAFVCAAMTMASATPLRSDMITTLFAANNGQAGNMFDINVLAPGGIVVEGFDLNLGAGTWDVNIYTIDGTYLGNESNAGAWTLFDSITGLAGAGADSPTNWDFADLTLGAGTQAFYIEVTNGFGLNYTNGTGEGNLYVDNGVVQIFEGTGNQSGFGNQFRPRIWNGTIYYSVTAIPEPGSAFAGIVGLFFCCCTMRRKKN